MRLSVEEFNTLKIKMERIPGMDLYLLNSEDLMDPKDYDAYISESVRHMNVIRNLYNKVQKKEVQVMCHEFLFKNTDISWKWYDQEQPIFYRYTNLPISCLPRRVRELHGGICVIVPDETASYTKEEAFKIAADLLVKYREDMLRVLRDWREIIEAKPL